MFFPSKNVKIFPCSHRGVYSEPGQVLNLVFDPESRLNTEANLTHIYGLAYGNDSYIISSEDIDTSKLWKLVIKGYYFEILDDRATIEDNPIHSFIIGLHETDIISNALEYRTSTRLAALQENSGTISMSEQISLDSQEQKCIAIWACTEDLSVDAPLYQLPVEQTLEYLKNQHATKEQGAKADTAVQSLTVLGKSLGKDNTSLTVKEAKSALGLKSAAYAETTAFDPRGAAKAVQGDTTHTVKDAYELAESKAAIGDVNSAIANAGHATAQALEEHANNTGTAKHVSADDITKWNTAANLVGQLAGDEEGSLGSITDTINKAIKDHSKEADDKYAAKSLEQDVTGLKTLVGELPEDATVVDYVDQKVAGLAGAMHFRGESTTDPTLEAGPTVTDVTAFASGDVVLWGNKEYVYDGTTWSELGDESIYAVKGEIKDADIAADAAIAQSKVAGLAATLGELHSTLYGGKSEDENYIENLSLITLKQQINQLSDKDATQDENISTISTKVEDLITEGGESNVIETVKVNDSVLTVKDKAVNIDLAGATVAKAGIADKVASKLTFSNSEKEFDGSAQVKVNAADLGVYTTDQVDNNFVKKTDKASADAYGLAKVDGTTITAVDGVLTAKLPTAATQSAVGLMSADDKTKLDGIADGANKTIVDTSLSATSTNPVQNMIIKSALDNKVDKVNGKDLSTNDFTDDEKEKLESVEKNANAYILPEATDTTLGGVKIGDNINVAIDGTISVNIATSDSAGLMSQVDKQKLDTSGKVESGNTGLVTGGQVYAALQTFLAENVYEITFNLNNQTETGFETAPPAQLWIKGISTVESLPKLLEDFVWCQDADGNTSVTADDLNNGSCMLYVVNTSSST